MVANRNGRRVDLSFLDDDRPELRGGREDLPRRGKGALGENPLEMPDRLAAANLKRFHRRRMEAKSRDVLAELAKREGEGPTQGSARRVVRSDGKEFPTLTLAARDIHVQTKIDNVCQAARRGIRGGGAWRWSYATSIPAGFFDWRKGDYHALGDTGTCRHCGQTMTDPRAECPGPNAGTVPEPPGAGDAAFGGGTVPEPVNHAPDNGTATASRPSPGDGQRNCQTHTLANVG
jgi:hypothetical protein